MMTPLSPHQPPINEWYPKPCLPPHHRGDMMVTTMSPEHQHMMSSLPVEHTMVGIPQAASLLHQRHSIMVTSEPHYSVPRNNSRVTPLSTDHETDHIGSGGQCHNTDQSNMVSTTDQASHQPELDHLDQLDKTPTNEAGKMMDLLETVR